MLMKKFLFVTGIMVALSFGISFSGCDIIDSPYTENAPTTAGPGDTTETSIRKVLLEDYTGFYCGTCPPASEIAASLDSIYGERLIVLGVHANFFAETTHGAPFNSPDLRTPAGEEYYNYFGFVSNPSGMVNRKPFNSSLILSKDGWSPAVVQSLQADHELDIALTPSYTASNRQLSIQAKVTYKKPGTRKDKLVILLSESPVIAPQKDYRLPAPSNILDFKHKHVLRGAVNGTWGDTLNISDIVPVGAVVERSYNTTLDNSWNPDNIYIIAYVFRDNGTINDREILQAEEKSIK